MPDHFSTPYFRSSLSLHPSKTTGLSQHETLLRLNQVLGTTVQYACAMLFDPEEIWQHPDLEKLRLVDISTAPSGWATNQQHFVTFQTITDLNPFWCSESVKGKSMSFKEWANPKRDFVRPIRGEQLEHLIIDCFKILKGKDIETQRHSLFSSDPDYTGTIPQSFTILEFEKTKHIT